MSHRQADSIQPVSNNRQKGGPTRPIDVLNDAVTAERLKRNHGPEIRWCEPHKKFYVWNGKVWAEDRGLQVAAWATETARLFYDDAKREKDGDARKALLTHARKAESNRGRNDTLGSFRCLPGIPVLPEELDTRPLINFQNGTIDLEPKEKDENLPLRPHRREDLLTKILPVPYDENALCPNWRKFLEKIMKGDEEKIDYLQRFLGYTLTPYTSEQYLHIFHGVGANGKSTLINLWLSLLGDYGRQLDPTLLLSRQVDAHPCNIATLKGLRFGVCQEVESGKRMAESQVKQLTGGDRIAARYIGGDWFEFNPTHKIVLVTNHKPIITGTDLGIWRRIILIPFEVSIPPEDQDKNLSKILYEERLGIMAWAVDGLKKWLKSGLPTEVASIQTATQNYQTEMNVFDGFIQDVCVLQTDLEVRSGDLRRAYEEWCEQNGHRPLTGNLFTNKLSELNCKNKKGSKGVRLWTGIGLHAPIDPRDIP